MVYSQDNILPAISLISVFQRSQQFTIKINRNHYVIGVVKNITCSNQHPLRLTIVYQKFIKVNLFYLLSIPTEPGYPLTSQMPFDLAWTKWDERSVSMMCIYNWLNSSNILVLLQITAQAVSRVSSMLTWYVI